MLKKKKALVLLTTMSHQIWIKPLGSDKIKQRKLKSNLGKDEDAQSKKTKQNKNQALHWNVQNICNAPLLNKPPHPLPWIPGKPSVKQVVHKSVFVSVVWSPWTTGTSYLWMKVDFSSSWFERLLVQDQAILLVQPLMMVSSQSPRAVQASRGKQMQGCPGSAGSPWKVTRIPHGGAPFTTESSLSAPQISNSKPQDWISSLFVPITENIRDKAFKPTRLLGTPNLIFKL